MREIYPRLLEVYQQEGLFVAGEKVLKKVLRYLFTTNSAFWLECDLEACPPAKITPQLPVDLHVFEKEEIIEWLKDEGESWMYNRREVKVALRENHLYPYLKYEGKIIGYLKAGINRVYVDDYKKVIRLPEATGFCYDYYIVPEFRGRRLSVYMNNQMLKLARNIGLRKVMIHVPPWNIASLKVSKKLGFKKVRYIRHIRILRFFKFWYNKRINYEDPI